MAGITINALTGSDSAPAKANEAEQKNDIGSAKDQISLTATNAKLAAYDTAYVGNGVASTDASDSVGRAVIKAVAEQIQAHNQVGKATIEITGYGTLDNINNNAKITIKTRDFTEKGTITLKDGVLTWGTSKAEKINSVIGQIVTYPKANGTSDGYSANYSGTWRVFYADDKQLFIIPTRIAEYNYSLKEPNSSPVIPRNAPNGNAYTGSDDVFATRTIGVVGNKEVTYGLTYNSKWKEKLRTGKDNQIRSKVTAYLCDPANWTRYVASNAPDGTYAVGGPTKELLAASWEATGRSAEWADTDVSAAGYAFDKPSGLYYDQVNSKYQIQRDILETETGKGDGLFNNGATYWLASPASIADKTVCVMYAGQGRVSASSYDDTSFVIRPLVSIPLSHVNITGTEGNYSVSLDFVE